MKSFKELDIWIQNNPQTDAAGRVYLMSRYDALIITFGQTKADWIMRNLEVKSWTFKGAI